LRTACWMPFAGMRRLDRFDEPVPQSVQVVSRFDDDSRNANRRGWDVVVFERFQRPCRRLLSGKDRVRRGEHLVEVVGADKLLQDGNMRVMRRIQSKTLREGLQQTGVVGHRVLNHCRVRFERDVDRRHRSGCATAPWTNAIADPSPRPMPANTPGCSIICASSPWRVNFQPQPYRPS
jgi:hypothetical protein